MEEAGSKLWSIWAYWGVGRVSNIYLSASTSGSGSLLENKLEAVAEKNKSANVRLTVFTQNAGFKLIGLKMDLFVI